MTTETTIPTTTKPLIRANLTVRIHLSGCPERGLEALAWRRERGLSERMDHEYNVTLERAVTEEECAQLLAAGALMSYYTDGTACVDHSSLPREYDPLTCVSYGHWATIDVSKEDGDIALVVRALASCRQQHDSHQAEMAARAKAEEDRLARDAAERRDALLAMLPRILAGEGTMVDTYRVSIDGVTHYRDAAGPEVKQQIEAEAVRRAKLVIAERDEWIRQHGSPRLQKALAAGMVDNMVGAYLDERIAHDLGEDWINWATAPEPKANDRLNPEESELDELAVAREKWPTADVQLRSVGGTDKHGDEHPWRPALVLDCPWDVDETAIKYLD